MRQTLPTAWVALLVINVVAHGGQLAGFTPTGFFDEQQRTWTADDVRILINAPGDFDPDKPTDLILYALPNGNTIEQTMGARLEPGMDWHFDIQHVAAQVRKLREIHAGENVIVACLEAETKSWPAWRKKHPDNAERIRALVDEVSRAIPGTAKRITLGCHSGGGSFIFGYINGGESIGDTVERIVWIDANYGYDDADKHGEKLLAWLNGDRSRHLVVIAYDDRQVKLNGKRIVSDTGGTYRASRRMIDRFKRETKLVESSRGPFEHVVAMEGRATFLIHTNKENKILHTVLVERNGVLEAMTIGTDLAGKWGGEFWSERAYAHLIQPATVATTAATKPRASGIPNRPAQAMGGHAFAETIADLPPRARENAIVQEILRGNVPDFLRKFAVLELDGVTLEVMPDYLGIGSDDDFVRMPMTPQSATIIAEAFGCVLPTRKVVNDIYFHADVKLEPKPLTEQREAVETFVQHNDLIESQRAGKPLGALVAGHKKDVIISNRLKEKPHKVAIYGWHKPDGKPIQPLYVGHVDWYVDYSHGIRLVRDTVQIAGKPRAFQEVLSDPKLHQLVSDEGPIDAAYP